MTLSKKIFAALLLAATTLSASAGGILTNTNQSVMFLRNPSRDAAIGIDGVYSNPAGVAFMNPGFHFGLNWQAAWQKRIVETTNPAFASGIDNNGMTTKRYEGTAKAPFIPSLQAAYNTGRWSIQFQFAVNGGGGKCEFPAGLGSFEGAVAQICGALKPFGADMYSANYYMRGNQYYFGITLGAAFKVTNNLSVYAGARALIGSASYKAQIANIAVKTQQATVPFGTFLDGTNAYITNTLNEIGENLPLVNAGIAQLEPVKDVPGYKEKYDELVATKATLEGAKAQLEGAQPQVKALDVYRDGVDLECDQKGFGVAPILGIDYKIRNFNFAAKYEFRTHMGMKNKSNLKEAMAIEAVNQFKDGETVREDTPAMLAVGAQWSILNNLRVSAGYHHFFDKQAVKYADKQKLLSHGTNEYLGGVEYDPIKQLTISGGFQITNYGLTDAYMSDLSFVVNSWSFGVGAKYQINDIIAINAAYFQTNYGHYKTAVTEAGVQNDFTRTNKTIGVGVELNF